MGLYNCSNDNGDVFGNLFLHSDMEVFQETSIEKELYYFTRSDQAIVQNLHTFGGYLVTRSVLYLQASFKR